MTFKNMNLGFAGLLALLLGLFSSAPAHAAIQVVTSIPDLAWATKEIGGDAVEVSALLKGTENPHFADAVPEFIRLVSNADVVCVVGLELEMGWMPKVLSRSGNGKVQPGGAGYCDTGKGISVLEKPSGAVNRSMGDVHPLGNPHYWLSPKALIAGSGEIMKALVRVDAGNAARYQKGYDQLKIKLTQVWEAQNKKFKVALAKRPGVKFAEYHKEFSYYLDAYGLTSFGSLEEKPGVPPSAGRVAEFATSAKTEKVALALAAEYSPEKTMKRFTEISGVPFVMLPTESQPKGAIKDYIELQNTLADKIIGALK